MEPMQQQSIYLARCKVLFSASRFPPCLSICLCPMFFRIADSLAPDHPARFPKTLSLFTPPSGTIISLM